MLTAVSIGLPCLVQVALQPPTWAVRHHCTAWWGNRRMGGVGTSLISSKRFTLIEAGIVIIRLPILSKQNKKTHTHTQTHKQYTVYSQENQPQPSSGSKKTIPNQKSNKKKRWWHKKQRFLSWFYWCWRCGTCFWHVNGRLLQSDTWQIMVSIRLNQEKKNEVGCSLSPAWFKA